jgi:hypothetical protein
MNTGTVKVGMLVRVYNQEHIWHNETGAVREVGPVFSRVELLGKLVRLPNHWLIEIENDQPNVGGTGDD